MAVRVLEETGLLPHLNPGVMSWQDLQRLKPVAPSMGMMLETTSRRLFEGAAPSRACPVCRDGRFPALEGEGASELVKLCGRQSVQVTPSARVRPDFDALERRLSPLGRVRKSPQLLNADVEDVSLTIFPDGRCVVRGTADPMRARSLYDRYVGG